AQHAPVVGGDAVAADRAVEPVADDAAGALEKQAEVVVVALHRCAIVEVAFSGKQNEGMRKAPRAARAHTGVTMPQAAIGNCAGAKGVPSPRRASQRGTRREAAEAAADFV